MNVHYSESYFHFGYENDKEIHVFCYATVYKSPDGEKKNVYGIFFALGDKRNEWGEIAGTPSAGRAQIGSIARVIGLIQKESRIVHIHTTNVSIVDNLERWIAFWKETEFNGRTEEHQDNIDLIDHLTELLKNSDLKISLVSESPSSQIPGCENAMNLAIAGPRLEDLKKARLNGYFH